MDKPITIKYNKKNKSCDGVYLYLLKCKLTTVGCMYVCWTERMSGRYGWKRNELTFFGLPPSGPPPSAPANSHSFITQHALSLILLFPILLEAIDNLSEKLFSLPGFILNFTTFGCLSEINLIGCSVECLCRSIAEIN